MSTETAPELLKKWKLNDLTIEMAIGQTLQHLQLLHDTDQQATIQRQKIISQLSEIQTILRSLRHDVDALIAHTGMPPSPPKPKRGRPRKR